MLQILSDGAITIITFLVIFFVGIALNLKWLAEFFKFQFISILAICYNRGTQRQFSQNICSEDDLRSRIFGTFVKKFLACLPFLGFSNI